VVARHEALRTTFTVSVGAGGVAVQRIAPPGRFVLPAIDLASLPEPRRTRRRCGSPPARDAAV